MARNAGLPRRINTETTRRAFNFRLFGEVVSELRRVTWPTREETMRLTLMVIAVAAVVGAFLGLVDIGFSELFERVLDPDWLF
jgi:preprotein translocase subunit SecE